MPPVAIGPLVDDAAFFQQAFQHQLDLESPGLHVADADGQVLEIDKHGNQRFFGHLAWSSFRSRTRLDCRKWSHCTSTTQGQQPRNRGQQGRSAFVVGGVSRRRFSGSSTEDRRLKTPLRRNAPSRSVGSTTVNALTATRLPVPSPSQCPSGRGPGRGPVRSGGARPGPCIRARQ